MSFKLSKTDIFFLKCITESILDNAPDLLFNKDNLDKIKGWEDLSLDIYSEIKNSLNYLRYNDMVKYEGFIKNRKYSLPIVLGVSLNSNGFTNKTVVNYYNPFYGLLVLERLGRLISFKRLNSLRSKLGLVTIKYSLGKVNNPNKDLHK